MTALARWALTAGASVLAWVPSAVLLILRRGELGAAEIEAPAKALMTFGAALQGVSILVAAYLVAGLQRCAEVTCRIRSRVAAWVAFVLSMPLAFVLRVVASAWLDNWSARGVGATKLLEVLLLLVTPVAFVALSLVLALLPLTQQRTRDILGGTLAIAGLLGTAAGVGQPGLIGLAATYALAVTVSLGASAAIKE